MATWPRLDYHTHICEPSLDVMLARAAKLGIREYAVTEHIFQLNEGHPLFPQIPPEGARIAREWYVATVPKRGAYYGVDVRLGLEVDFVPGLEAAVQQVLDGVAWDVLLGSVHEIDGFDLFESSPDSPEHGETLWRRYVELLTAAARSGMFDVITHPVRNTLLNEHVPADIDELLDELTQHAARGQVAIELNGEDTESWPQHVQRLANACARNRCAISFGSDAHGPRRIGRGMQQAMEIAVDAGVTHAVSFRQRERRLVPLLG